MIKTKVLISGHTGSLGQAVTKILLDSGSYDIIGYSRCELKQSQLPNRDRITQYIGDVRDERRLLEATRGVDLIFHFAALKRVDTMESNPEESVATNILGTQNVLYAQRINHIPRVVLSSTDKAVSPINVYGCCKQVAEKLVLRNPNNVVCRYGNVLASRGSVIPQFISDIKNGKPVSITDVAMTRFFIKIEDAAKFVVDSSISESGGLKIPYMKACRMVDLAGAIGDILSNPVAYRAVGIRPGEKLSECLRMEHEGGARFSDTCDRFTPGELRELLKPIVEA